MTQEYNNPTNWSLEVMDNHNLEQRNQEYSRENVNSLLTTNTKLISKKTVMGGMANHQTICVDIS